MWWRRLRYVLLLIVLCAIATCPAAKRACTAKARSAEADELLEYLADRVAAHVATTGRVPPTAAGPTPQPGCCEQGGVCSPDAAAWSAGWRELGFSIDGEHRFAYQYTPDASGLAATLRATGDVECAETPATVEVQLTVVGGKVSRVWSRKASGE
ncbi:MAG TPA: hypothetical protein VH165_02945 [Kofleriaceae bacterium]|jgi:hypothetical protein|nr:hypothetical protein [Kofleriaceae bacterium]